MGTLFDYCMVSGTSAFVQLSDNAHYETFDMRGHQALDIDITDKNGGPVFCKVYITSSGICDIRDRIYVGTKRHVTLRFPWTYTVDVELIPQRELAGEYFRRDIAWKRVIG